MKNKFYNQSNSSTDHAANKTTDHDSYSSLYSTSKAKPDYDSSGSLCSTSKAKPDCGSNGRLYDPSKEKPDHDSNNRLYNTSNIKLDRDLYSKIYNQSDGSCDSSLNSRSDSSGERALSNRSDSKLGSRSDNRLFEKINNYIISKMSTVKSKKTDESKDNSRRKRSPMAGQLLFQYLFTMMLLIVILYGGVFVAWLICQGRIWYGSEFLYPVIHMVWDNLIPVLFTLSITIIVGVTYYYLAKPLRYLDEVIAASKKLAHPSDDPIELSAAMHNVQDELNLVREQALRNAIIAKEAEQRKNDLIVYLAHDLKTPLTSVIGYLTLLKDEKQISEPLRERYTHIALDKAERLEDLINEFFDITRFNLTALTLEMELINLSRMLEQIASEFEPVLAEKSLRWHLEIQQDIMFSCDPDKLQRVFDNLIRNAVNYSYPGTEISVFMEREEQETRIRVCNHGRTIPPEKLSHIFEQFFRVDSSRTSATGGSGLGLAIAKEIVQLHGGSIQAHSSDESIVFTVILP